MTNDDEKLLDAARGGNETAFNDVIAPHRAALQAHCYRLLGSTHDAEDATQETLLNAWRSLSRFEGRSSLKTWLYSIATNACLRTLERRPGRVLPRDYGPAAGPDDPFAPPLVESVWIEPYPDASLGLEGPVPSPAVRYEQRESVELAFVAALQLIPAKQRAVLILRDVLGFSSREVAETLRMTPTAVDQSLQRARKTVDERLPARSQQVTLRTLDNAQFRRTIKKFVDAWERADVDAVVALLSKDATLAMPPYPMWYRGQAAIAAFLRAAPLSQGSRWRLLPTSANGQLAFGGYVWRHAAQSFIGIRIMILTVADAQISEITAFGRPELLPQFGLPEKLEP